ncbi:MAG TPA: metallopeptidase TldD-related protein, partial [Alphaproteobacteria bacterium]|nr:metallopeptidase TldD-related protein [Alphaproteobacteria bacterium]
MNPHLKTEELFFKNTGLDEARVKQITSEALQGADDGELFLEYADSESFAFDDGRLKVANHDTSQGFGLRAVAGEATGLAHATSLDEESIKRAASSVGAVRGNHKGTLALDPIRTNRQLYNGDSPLSSLPSEKKIALLQEIDAYARARDPRVAQVSISLGASWQAVRILRPTGEVYADLRPLTRLYVSLIMRDGTRQESGWAGGGGREIYARFVEADYWKNLVDTAYKMADVNLRSVEAPAGEMTVVLGPGYPGILLHEAIGHGLEGDFNRKGTSAFAGLMGSRVAAEGVTVVDDGTIADRRGSLTIDDEGTPTQSTTLIENGILVGFMQDRLNARLMGKKSTGNGRRQSFAHKTLPRMTNTVMMGGKYDPAEIIASVKNGIYATQFGGGQVDITSGKFVFSAQEAYKIENGKITAPIKGAT